MAVGLFVVSCCGLWALRRVQAAMLSPPVCRDSSSCHIIFIITTGIIIVIIIIIFALARKASPRDVQITVHTLLGLG